ncbi:MAG TPA: hypothetical protein ENI97_00055 [Gammaproteobacteria bacterium]|nr:hypothetical protein [Gammaproteobacteria bacterium]
MNKSSSRLLPALGIMALLALVITAGLIKQADQPPAGWVEGWRLLPPFTHPRRAPSATVANGYLYVVGGVDDHNRYVLPVEYAPILADGQLGPWRETRPLRTGRFYLAAVSHQGFLYALGGGGGKLGDDNVPLASVERAKINADGSLQPWQHHSYLTTPRRGLKATVVNNRLYAIGGYNGRFLKSTEFLTPDESDAPQWQLSTELAKVDRYIHASATLGNRLFLLGGHVQKGGPMSYGDVESTTVMDNGQLAPWRIAPSHLLTPRFIASAFALEHYLYIAGGHDGVRRLDSVEMAPISADGRVGPWTSLAALNQQRSATAVAINGKTVYLAGGMDDQGVLRTVEMAQLGPHGKLGYVPHVDNNTELAGQ